MQCKFESILNFDNLSNEVILSNFRSALDRVSLYITSFVENKFERLGEIVASHPLKVIAICLVITTITSIGVLNFRQELRPFKLWLPQNSDFIKVRILMQF